jgi:DNA-binding response OmpR family regulator
VQDAPRFRDFVVLVVEDNPDVLEATTYLIEAAFGCKVLTASSCMEALALMDAGIRIDLIFSEAVLPGKDGLTLARLARERRADVPVVLATGWTDEIDSILDRGYVALLKPYSVQRLEGIFTELLCKSPGTARAPDGTIPVPSASPMASTAPEWRQLRSSG